MVSNRSSSNQCLSSHCEQFLLRIQSVALFLMRLLLTIFRSNYHSVLADTQELVACMTTCIERVYCWMVSNRLCLNPTKTELIWLSSPRRTNLLSTSPICLFGTKCSLLSTFGKVKWSEYYMHINRGVWRHVRGPMTGGQIDIWRLLKQDFSNSWNKKLSWCWQQARRV